MDDRGKAMFTCYVSCPHYVPDSCQLEGFPRHCSVEWLYGELGVSVIIPQTAAGYGILSKFHFLLTAPAAQKLFAVGLVYSRHSLQMCHFVDYWGQGGFCLCQCGEVCSSGGRPNVQSYSCLFALLVKQHLAAYGQLLIQAR